MEFLYALQKIANPILDAIMLLITHLGEETVFLIIAMVLLWCVDKYNGFYMLTVGFLGTQINTLLKVSFRIERPWVKDPNFHPVESAIPEATGYSFPSGHTQSSVGNFGSIARFTKSKWMRIVCIVLCMLVPFSRMYLGVHTPMDVAVSFVIALILVFVFYPIVEKGRNNVKVMRILFAVMLLWSVGTVVFMHLYPFPSDVANSAEIWSGYKNAYKLLGAISGLWLVFEIERKYINFCTKAPWYAQVLKVVLGLGLTLAIKEICYAVFGLFLPELWYRFAAYFCMVLFAGAVWPLTFKFFAKMGCKKCSK